MFGRILLAAIIIGIASFVWKNWDAIRTHGLLKTTQDKLAESEAKYMELKAQTELYVEMKNQGCDIKKENGKFVIECVPNT